jgi:putative ABC transport system ATP-binding protein
MNRNESVIATRNVTRIYTMKGGDVRALSGVTLDIDRGEYISILGPSGSGKSTLFNMIGGLDRPTSGSVRIDGIDLSTLDSRTLAWFRCCRIGYVFQTFNLIPTLSALENVMLPATFRMLGENVARARAREMLESVGLADRTDHYPDELSGGQMQRVAIARALVNEPRIILADEPTGNLDLNTGSEIIELLHQLSRERKVTVVTATHDHKMLDVSDRIVWFEEGRVARIQQRGEFEVKVGSIE